MHSTPPTSGRPAAHTTPTRSEEAQMGTQYTHATHTHATHTHATHRHSPIPFQRHRKESWHHRCRGSKSQATLIPDSAAPAHRNRTRTSSHSYQ